jgi:hypothetical protein
MAQCEERQRLKKRGGPHSPQTFVEFRFDIRLHYALVNGSRWIVMN